MIVIVFNLLWIFSRNCLVVYHCTCSWSITKSFTIDSFVTNSMFQKHRGRRKAYRIENAASQDASITWKNWVSIFKEQNSMVAYVNGTVFLQYTIPLKTSRVSLFEGPFCKVVTDPHIMWNWQGGGGGGCMICCGCVGLFMFAPQNDHTSDEFVVMCCATASLWK